MAYLIQHSFQDVDDLSKDRYVNTFHALYLGAGDPDGAAYSQIITPIVDFFNAAGTGTSVRNFIANHARGPGATVKVYNLLDAMPRAPREEYTYTPTVSGSSFPAMPTEVSMCISFQAGLTSGMNPQRRRGRIYVGPLNQSTQDAGTENAARPSTSAMALMVQAYSTLIGAVATGPWQLVQHSKTGGGSNAIVKIWCDNAYDTQRRRGVAATVRSSVTI